MVSLSRACRPPFLLSVNQARCCSHFFCTVVTPIVCKVLFSSGVSLSFPVSDFSSCLFFLSLPFLTHFFNSNSDESDVRTRDLNVFGKPLPLLSFCFFLADIVNPPPGPSSSLAIYPFLTLFSVPAELLGVFWECFTRRSSPDPLFFRRPSWTKSTAFPRSFGLLLCIEHWRVRRQFPTAFI